MNGSDDNFFANIVVVRNTKYAYTPKLLPVWSPSDQFDE